MNRCAHLERFANYSFTNPAEPLAPTSGYLAKDEDFTLHVEVDGVRVVEPVP